MATKIETMRDFLTLVSNGTITDEVKAFALTQIDKLNEKNERRKTSKATLTHKAENEDFKAQILEILSDGKIHVASELAKALDVSTQKISALMIQLSDNGKITVTEVKEKGKSKVKGYALPTETEIVPETETEPETETAPETETEENDF